MKLSSTAALIAVAPAIALADLAAPVLILAGAPQAFAIRQAVSALSAISTTVALADLAAPILVFASATQAFARTTAPKLHLLHHVFETTAETSAYGCGYSSSDAQT
jgi:hypothetical protein